MIDSILKSTRGKPCSCPPGKICTHCKAKKNVHPQGIVVESKRHLKPVTNDIYEQNRTIQYFEKPKRWRLSRRHKAEPQQPKSTSICRWYRRRKALKQLIKEHEKEKELLRKQKREEYERERLIDFINWEQSKRQRAISLPPTKTVTSDYAPKRNQSLPPKKKLVYVKETAAIVKPRARSKYVSVKRYNPRDSITRRFVNYCYRFCCQLYCYLTCVIIIICIIFLV